MDASLDTPSMPSEEGLPGPAAAPWMRRHRRWRDGPAPWLHREVARRMVDRLAVIRSQPAHIQEWDPACSASQDLLLQAYPQAQWHGVDTWSLASAAPWSHSLGSKGAANTAWWDRWRAAARRWGGASVAEQGPQWWTPAQAAAQPAALVWSNLALHTHPNPRRMLEQWHAALAVDGFLMFSTFGPGTLPELRRLWSQHGWGPHQQAFVDMHDWGDALVKAGFADPVLDQEVLTLTWATPELALAELRSWGGNAHPERFAGLRGRRWRAEMLELLADLCDAQGRVALRLELVYGHAFRPVSRIPMSAHTEVSVDSLREMLRQKRNTDSL